MGQTESFSEFCAHPKLEAPIDHSRHRTRLFLLVLFLVCTLTMSIFIPCLHLETHVKALSWRAYMCWERILSAGLNSPWGRGVTSTGWRVLLCSVSGNSGPLTWPHTCFCRTLMVFVSIDLPASHHPALPAPLGVDPNGATYQQEPSVHH